MLILASNSPRRKQLLSLGGWDFSVLAAPVDESVLPEEAPADYVRRLAQNKARAALDAMPGGGRRTTGGQRATGRSGAVVLAADTAVVDLDGLADGASAILGKPSSPADAEAMLRRLRGRTHQVYTGLAALRAVDGRMLSEVVITEVPMRRYSDDEMLAYIATGDPVDKAGAYAIQNTAFHPVQNLQGCFANVMGLPVCHAARLLAHFEIFPTAEIFQECQRSLDYPCKIYQQALRGYGARPIGEI